MRGLRPLAALLAALALAGCATPPAPVGADARAVDPSRLEAWRASGRMALSAAGEGGSGSFVWEQRGETTRLDLRGPLGAGALRVIAAPGAFTLTDGGGRRLDAEAAHAELESRLGADLPWDQMRHWMLGRAAPGEAATVEAGGGVGPRSIEQAGWRIGYEDFGSQDGLVLPRRFTATRGEVRVRVVVDDWRLGSSAAGEP